MAHSITNTERVASRFWRHVRRGDVSECWLWVGGQFGGTDGDRYGRPAYAHRVSYELAHGSVPGGVSVLHHCDVRLCVNPAHLFLGTQADNLHDASRKGRLNVPRLRHRATVEAVVARWVAGGITQRQLALDHGVSVSLVSRWLRPVKARPYERRKAA